MGACPHGQIDDSTNTSGAVYFFTRDGAFWSQQAYIKASNTGAGDSLGRAVSLSADGDTLAAGSRYESSSSTGIGGDQGDNSVDNAGAIHLY
ncbi:MAG: hypothetical protein GY811_11860 [Myxococcales bacterium]|nr:hypothetical protein [Myxococcales bacterium]